MLKILIPSQFSQVGVFGWNFHFWTNIFGQKEDFPTIFRQPQVWGRRWGSNCFHPCYFTTAQRSCFFALADEPSEMDAEQSTQTARDKTSLTQTSTTTQPDAQSKPVAMATAAEPTTHTVSVPLPPPVEDVKNKKGEIFCTGVKYIYTISETKCV